jgi:chloramphenicol-sensitive protein RarD
MTPLSNQYSAGIAYGLAAFSLFSLLPIYLQWLQPISGYTVLYHRILWSSLLLILVLGLLGKLKDNLKPLMQIKQWPGLLLGSGLIGIQWGLFVWAPLNEQTLELSLGYFLMPLIMVFIGKVFYKETLRPLQWGALLLASIGIGFSYLQSQGLSLVVLLIITGYPCYLMLRRHQVLPTFSAFLIENLILLPFAIVGILLYGGIEGESLSHPFAYDWKWLALFLGVAILGSAPMLCFIAANKRLPMSVLGVVSYIEPTLIFLVAYFLLGETLSKYEILTYGFIAAGLILTLIDGIKEIKKADPHNGKGIGLRS